MSGGKKTREEMEGDREGGRGLRRHLREPLGPVVGLKTARLRTER